jgi:hypothetical protein
MARRLAKFTTRVDPKVRAEVRAIAAKDGKQLQSVFDEALRDLVEKRRLYRRGSEIRAAFGESLAEFDALFRELAKRPITPRRLI